MENQSSGSRTSIRLVGYPIQGALDRQSKVPGFDQSALSAAKVLCIGAGGIVSQIAPNLVRKGVGHIVLLDSDVVEPSNLARQRFYGRDLGANKAVALARNLQGECTAETVVEGHALRFEEAVELGVDLTCDIAVCGVDNNPARVAASRFFRNAGKPVVFSAVSTDADYGYVFVQTVDGPCIGCLYPDMASDDRFPCPGTPAVVDILQAVGALAVFAVDSLIMNRKRDWNYRTVRLSDGTLNASALILSRSDCSHS